MTAVPTIWRPGDTVVLQEVWRGRLWSARPVTVVEDSPARTLVWCPKGVQWKAATTPATRPRAATRLERFVACLERCDWVLGDFEWGVSVLGVLQPGSYSAVWASERGWYVNFQEPLHRTGHGFQTMDLMLDLLVTPDRGSRRKDDDEFDGCIERGLIDRRTAVAVEAALEAATAEVAACAYPFHDDLLHFRPDPEWATPALGENWDRLS